MRTNCKMTFALIPIMSLEVDRQYFLKSLERPSTFRPLSSWLPCTTKGVRHVYLHLSSTCMATQGGAVSQLFIVCLQLLLDSQERNWFIRFFFPTHLPKPHSKSCQWQLQVHTSSLKDTFVAADLCVVTTGVIGTARACDYGSSNSNLIGRTSTNHSQKLLPSQWNQL